MGAVRLASFAFALLAGGCSLLLNPAAPEQCSTTPDCEASPALHGRVCQAGYCVLPTTPLVPVDTDGGAGCVSDAICTQANSNKASVCKTAGGPCIPWQTEACPLIRGAWDDPNAIIVGTITPQTILQVDKSHRKSDYGTRVLRAIDLGRDDFEAALQTGFTFGNKNRPLAVLHCDSSLDPAGAQAVMDHLTDVVGVQAVIVGIDEDLAAISARAIAKQVALICTDCLAPLPAGPLVWRAAPPIAPEAPLAAWRINAIESTLPPNTLKVATLSDPSMSASSFVQALEQTLSFNGKSPAQNGTDFYLPIQVEDGRKASVRVTDHAEAIVAFEPDVIVVSMAEDFTTYYLPYIETHWHASKARPHYVANQLTNELGLLAAAIGSDDDLRRRISGTRPAFAQPLQSNLDAFTLHYKTTYNFQSPDGAQGGYDAFYSLAFAIGAASTQGPFDGAHVSAGFASLVAGPSADYDAAKVKSSLLGLLGPDRSINARGVASPLDWNLQTHDFEDDVGMFCLVRDGKGQLAFNPDAGPRYSPATKLVTGTYSADCTN